MSDCILPPIQRARDYHVYTQDGRKLLDLYRANGHCLLGYSVPGMATAMKARCDRHLWVVWPHRDQHHLLQSLRKAFVGYEPLICADHFTAARVLHDLGAQGNIELIPGLADLNDTPQILGGTSFSWQIWLPFLPLSADFALAVLPGMGSASPCVLLRRQGLWSTAIQTAYAGCSNLQSTALLHTLPFLFALGAFPNIGRLIPPGFRTHADTLGEWHDSTFKQIEGDGWIRRGPYCAWPGNQADYAEIWQRALSMGIIMTPHFKGLSILPGIWSRSEAKVMSLILRTAGE